MGQLDHLLEKNRSWADSIKAEDPQFFHRLSNQQAPEYLWIGCADSRVPANQIVDLMPGELFVHRNVANVVVHTDFNCLSVLQFAIEVLKVKHILVVGHYGCGGVRAALRNEGFGLISNWLRHVQDVRDRHQPVLDVCGSELDRVDRLCELNVVEQVGHVCQNNIVQEAWKRGQRLSVHGFVYDVADGILRDMGLSVSDAESWETIKQNSLDELIVRPVRSGRQQTT
ncbi:MULTISPECIES: carbonate dehydratase [unclassified Marinobacter]|uniref:carbonate dehydratase n=1 Tax=unclassified Marinobacter TaxID=83889 RepID=UPI0026E146EB|nr:MULTISPECIES: carbonate dehydratase [unclassified Marinobacter]MDO6440769.1 carbonate dehydratase [Marinobacter sp. 2_MG-2023]MDO6823596.1 carbonate dehydratase [Marinobacter sp. 1_MG-2023]